LERNSPPLRPPITITDLLKDLPEKCQYWHSALQGTAMLGTTLRVR
jgi:hypothetical protein